MGAAMEVAAADMMGLIVGLSEEVSQSRNALRLIFPC